MRALIPLYHHYRNKIIGHIIKYEILVIVGLSLILSVTAIIYYFNKGAIVSYGDAESHLNIAKRVVHSITPGMAQLGGIWLPLPHMFMIPFVYFDGLWRSGIAGSIVSSASYVATTLFVYKTVYLFTKHRIASFLAASVFATNPNILYMQTTPMTELPLIAFFTLSSYFFFRFLYEGSIKWLLLASFFGFCASLTRYEGWFLVGVEALLIIAYYAGKKEQYHILEGGFILFSTLAFFGIFLWLLWDLLILGDPLYFTNSPFSAKSQQQGWLAKGQLPAYHDPPLAFLYYAITTLNNTGIIIVALAVLGIALFLFLEGGKKRYLIPLILITPFIFYVLTLYAGQSIIFTPELTPESYQWQIFNVRYGLMMVAPIALLSGYLMGKSKVVIQGVIGLFIIFQVAYYCLPGTRVITYEDGTTGLSASKRPDAEGWLSKNYDRGLILMDDYARTMSIIRSGIPMQRFIYIGNKPYWDESLREPEKHARWIIIQKDDALWREIYDQPEKQGRLFKYFEKAYTSPEILVFKRNDTMAQQ